MKAVEIVQNVERLQTVLDELIQVPQFRQYALQDKLSLIDSRFKLIDNLLEGGLLKIAFVPAKREPMYENDDCRRVGLMATCNACDRIVFEDENDREAFVAAGGYCSECR